jgi:hypothetical protein
MTYATSQQQLGKSPITVVVIQADTCTLTYGVSPCTASGAVGSECYNTRNTCQDPANYDKTTKDYTFCSSRANLPIGENMIPCIDKEPQQAPASITGGKGLGNRAVISITFNDFTHSDRGSDPYWETRAVGGEDSGTFWGKWLARNIYYEGRTVIVKTGYINDPFSWDDFESEYYDIDRIGGPSNGKVTLKAKDILTRTYARKARYPAASTGVLLADITAVATSATLSPTGVGNSEYPASGYVSIGKEIAAFTRSGDVLTLTRAQWGSVASTASAEDTVQLCVAYEDVNVVDALNDVLTNGADIPASYIPYGTGSLNWDDEKELWLSNSKVTGILTEPTPVEDIISEWSDHFMFDIWWDLVNQEIKIKALSPEPSGVAIAELTEDYHILRDSIKVTKNPDDRITTVIIRYAKLNHAEKDDPENFAKTLVFTDISAEGSDKYNESSIKEIKSKWFDAEAYASQYGGRQIARFLNTPTMIEFSVDAKDDANISLAGRVQIDTSQIQSVTGASEPTNFQITEIRPMNEGDIIKCKGLISSFSGRYFFIAPDGTPDYSSATEEQKAAYGFICLDTGLFSDGSAGYKII